MRERQSGGGARRRLVSGPDLCTDHCQVSLIPTSRACPFVCVSGNETKKSIHENYHYYQIW